MCTRGMCEMLGFWGACLKILKQEPDAVLGWICTPGPPSMHASGGAARVGFALFRLLPPKQLV
jgi:hypothetical protein